MKITEISSDGLGVSALIAAAGAVHDLLKDRNVALGVMQHDSGAEDTLVVFAERQDGGDVLGVTVETNPRLLVFSKGEAKPEHREEYGDHYPGVCACVRPCCNTEDGELCICPTCESENHRHADGPESSDG